MPRGVAKRVEVFCTLVLKSALSFCVCIKGMKWNIQKGYPFVRYKNTTPFQNLLTRELLRPLRHYEAKDSLVAAPKKRANPFYVCFHPVNKPADKAKKQESCPSVLYVPPAVGPPPTGPPQPLRRVARARCRVLSPRRSQASPPRRNKRFCCKCCCGD